MTQDDVIVDIPKDQERRFGCAGKMLKPSRATVEALVKKVQRGKVITIPLLRKSLDASHNAQVTCPFLTKRALAAIAEDSESKAPFWRVVAENGEMLRYYPGGGTEQARRLRNESVMIEATPGKIRVMNLRDARWTEREEEERQPR